MNQPLHLYTEDFVFTARLKNIFKAVLGKDNRGPSGVFKSLEKGLQGLGAVFMVNEMPKESINVACVLSGLRTLVWAIEQKKHGKIKKIIAGPNLIVLPQKSGILSNQLIDKIIVPSKWVGQSYIDNAPELAEKIVIWPAGVDVPSLARASQPKNIDFLIYDKTGQSGLFKDIVKYLSSRGFGSKIIEYGKHQQADYFRLLENSKYMIYLSKSESQGLAMFEAWARDVPTLVWERGFFEYQGYRLEGNTASPYLSAQAGMRFKNFEEFKQNLHLFMSKSFKSREYVLNNFTHRISAQKYLEIIQDD